MERLACDECGCIHPCWKYESKNMCAFCIFHKSQKLDYTKVRLVEATEYSKDLSARLRDPSYAAEYLRAILDDIDENPDQAFEILTVALKNIASVG